MHCSLSEALIFSLGVEARKRVTIGVELASRPTALLFLDEPTSGLDAQSAFNLVRFLRKLAAAGQVIMVLSSFQAIADETCVIVNRLHHPSTLRPPIRELRPPSSPRTRWRDCLLRRHRTGFGDPPQLPGSQRRRMSRQRQPG